ncbi:hypothetical protein CCP4SC76_4070001 [Gammaproteobacteria bacterium]
MLFMQLKQEIQLNQCQRKEDEEKKRKVAEAEAEKERKIADAKQKARDKFKADLFDALDQTIKEYGEETAVEWVNEWLCAHKVAQAAALR